MVIKKRKLDEWEDNFEGGEMARQQEWLKKNRNIQQKVKKQRRGKAMVAWPWAREMKRE